MSKHFGGNPSLTNISINYETNTLVKSFHTIRRVQILERSVGNGKTLIHSTIEQMIIFVNRRMLSQTGQGEKDIVVCNQVSPPVKQDARKKIRKQSLVPVLNCTESYVHTVRSMG